MHATSSYLRINVATQLVQVSHEEGALVRPHRLQLGITHVLDVAARLSALLQRYEGTRPARIEARF